VAAASAHRMRRRRRTSASVAKRCTNRAAPRNLQRVDNLVDWVVIGLALLRYCEGLGEGKGEVDEETVNCLGRCEKIFIAAKLVRLKQYSMIARI
jgi:hypothetical protein